MGWNMVAGGGKIVVEIWEIRVVAKRIERADKASGWGEEGASCTAGGNAG